MRKWDAAEGCEAPTDVILYIANSMVALPSQQHGLPSAANSFSQVPALSSVCVLQLDLVKNMKFNGRQGRL